MALVALCVPAGSSADVLSVYQDLAERRLSPAPLVPTVVPPSLAPLDRTIATSPSRRRSGYGLRMAREGPAAVIVFERGAFKTVGAALRDGRRLGFKPRRTRVRGRRGHLLTRHLGPTQRTLLWVEDRRVYTLAAGTPRRVSLKQLRATAAGLQHLGRDYIGTHADPDNGSGGVAVTTERTVTAYVDFEAQCVAPDGSPAGIRAGSARVATLPYRANAFSFDIGTDGWTGTVSGTVSSAAIALTVRASGTFGGMTCDTGALSLALTSQRSSPGSSE